MRPTSSSVAGRSSASLPAGWWEPWASAISRCSCPGGSQQVASAAGAAGAWAQPARNVHRSRCTPPPPSHVRLHARPNWTRRRRCRIRTSSTWWSTSSRSRCRRSPIPPTTRRSSAPGTSTWRSTPAQFPERMTLFWHGLLTSDYRKAARLPVRPPAERAVSVDGPERLPHAHQRRHVRPADDSLPRPRGEHRSRAQRELQPRAHGAVHARRRQLHRDRRARGGSRLLRDPHRPRRREWAADPAAEGQGLDACSVHAGVRATARLRARRSKVSWPQLSTTAAARHSSGTPGTSIPRQALDIILSQPSCAPHIARDCAGAVLHARSRRQRSITSVADAISHQRLRHQDADARHLHQRGIHVPRCVSVAGSRPGRVHGRHACAHSRRPGLAATVRRAVRCSHGPDPL